MTVRVRLLGHPGIDVDSDDPLAALRWCLADVRPPLGLPGLLRGEFVDNTARVFPGSKDKIQGVEPQAVDTSGLGTPGTVATAG
jgi:hypothetical protein